MENREHFVNYSSERTISNLMKRISEELDIRDMTPDALFNRIDSIDRARVYKIQKGIAKDIKLSEVVRICNALEINVNDILVWENDK